MNVLELSIPLDLLEKAVVVVVSVIYLCLIK